MPDVVSPTAAAARMEGTWHGPGGDARAALSARSSPALLGRRPGAGAAVLGDETWHGGARAPGGGAAAALAAWAGADPAEAARFLRHARRQRAEQRKVARLMLEGSTHGGGPAVGGGALQALARAGGGAGTAGEGGGEGKGGAAGGGLLHKLRAGMARALKPTKEEPEGEGAARGGGVLLACRGGRGVRRGSGAPAAAAFDCRALGLTCPSACTCAPSALPVRSTTHD